jgi:putative alpha-1,2-mannosidase
VGISGVSLEGAQRNWQAEAEGHTFDQIRKATQEKWQKQLETFQIADEDSPQKQMFYTCLYFAMLYPQLYSDVDGRYRSSDAQVYRTTTRYFAGVLGL